MTKSYLIAGIRMNLDSNETVFYDMLRGYEIEDTTADINVRIAVMDDINVIGEPLTRRDKIQVTVENGYTHAYYYDDDDYIYGSIAYDDHYEHSTILLARQFNLNGLSYVDVGYMLFGAIFNYKLTYYHGISLHGSAIKFRGGAIIFTAPSGVGKSTQARLWREHFGDEVSVINDDKPALRMIDGKLYCYGTPFSGKDHLNTNDVAPVKAIINVTRADTNTIVPLTNREKIVLLFEETARSFLNNDINYNNIEIIGDIIATTPMLRLGCTPTDEAVKVTYDAISEVL